MPRAQTITNNIKAFLDAMPAQEKHSRGKAGTRKSLAALQKDCNDLLSKAATRTRIRTVHHFACSGGTLISKFLAAQPNIVLLSEIDPLSKLPLNSIAFAPFDIIKQAQTGLRPLDDSAVQETFLAGLHAMHKDVVKHGRRLVLRDHAHSHFCTNVDPDSRPTLLEILQPEFDILGIVTVRHPLDAYLSLIRNNWSMFSPRTFDEYCRRNILFLNRYEDLPVFRYEDFVCAPDDIAQQIAAQLELPYARNWQSLLPIIRITGDSGRGGNSIELRPRREISKDLRDEVQSSQAYQQLCARLNYPAEIDAPLN